MPETKYTLNQLAAACRIIDELEDVEAALSNNSLKHLAEFIANREAEAYRRGRDDQRALQEGAEFASPSIEAEHD